MLRWVVHNPHCSKQLYIIKGEEGGKKFRTQAVAKQSSHENIRGPGAQNDSALFIASSGDRRLRPRVFRRTILHVWGRCFPLHASQLVPTTSPPLASPPLACIANDYCARGNAWGNAWGGNAGEILVGLYGTVLVLYR